MMPTATYNLKEGYRYGFNGKEKDNEVKGLKNSYDFGARMLDVRLGRWFVIDPLFFKYYGLSPYSFVGNIPTMAIDPDGKRILFINGHYQDNFIGRYLLGADKGGRQYWQTSQEKKEGVNSSAFVNGSQDFFFDYSEITDNNFIDGSSSVGFDESGAERYERGYSYAKAQLKTLTTDLKKGETFKLVTHSEGSAFGAGIAQALIDNGYEVETVVHLSADEADEFKTPTEPVTLQLSYKNDWVTGNLQIKGSDKFGIVNSKKGLLKVHGSTRVGSGVWKEIADLKSAELQFNVGFRKGKSAFWTSTSKGSTPRGTTFTEINEVELKDEKGNDIED